VDILESQVTNPPVHHVLHDVESVFWVGLLDGFQRSQMTEGDIWLQNLYAMPNLQTIGYLKANAFRTPNLEKFENSFSESYSVIWKFLRKFILRVFDATPDPIYLYDYGDQHDHEKIFDDVDGLFDTFIPMEQERSTAAARAETVTESRSEYNVIENNKSVRRSARIAKAKP
jgi:hypothetical protein